MSPRKVRLVGDAVKGKNVAQADIELSFMPKKAARTIKTLIRSALHNAQNNQGMAIENLIVKNVEVNQGPTLKRWRARARGSAAPINKRTSNIVVTLAEKVVKNKKKSQKAEIVEAPKNTSTVVKKTVEKKVSKKVESKENNPKA